MDGNPAAVMVMLVVTVGTVLYLTGAGVRRVVKWVMK